MRPDLAGDPFRTWDGSDNPEQLQFGQVLPIEGAWLRQAARAVQAPNVIVELGSYTGKSTCCLVVGSAEGHQVPVYAIDLWTSGTSRKGRNFRRFDAIRDGAQSHSKFHLPVVMELFQKRMQRFDRAHVVTPLMTSTVEAVKEFADPVGLLFIDAEHTYEAAKADFEAWLPRLSATGVVACHDHTLPAGLISGVKRYIDELIADDPSWCVTNVIGSMCVLQRQST